MRRNDAFARAGGDKERRRCRRRRTSSRRNTRGRNAKLHAFGCSFTPCSMEAAGRGLGFARTGRACRVSCSSCVATTSWTRSSSSRDLWRRNSNPHLSTFPGLVSSHTCVGVGSPWMPCRTDFVRFLAALHRTPNHASDGIVPTQQRHACLLHQDCTSCWRSRTFVSFLTSTRVRPFLRSWTAMDPPSLRSSYDPVYVSLSCPVRMGFSSVSLSVHRSSLLFD